MFTNYYKLMNISSNASDEEINAAIEQSKLSKFLLKEIKMILQNKSLKAMYDAELITYEISGSKQNYEITNPVLDRELKKLRMYISSIAHTAVEVETEEPKKNNYSWIWFLIFLLIGGLGKCMSSYYEGRKLEENAQKFHKENIRINKLVADAIYSLKGELPIEFTGLGKVGSIESSYDCVIFKMNIQEDPSYGLRVDKINQKEELAKEVIMTCIETLSEKVKKELITIADQSYNLTILISGSVSEETGFIHLSSEEIMLALEQSHFSSSEEASLGMTALATKLMLPIVVDGWTTWIDTRLMETSFMYIYNLDDKEHEWKEVDIDLMKREQISILRQNKDVIGKVIRCCMATHRNLIFRYFGSSSQKTIDVVLTEDDLKNI